MRTPRRGLSVNATQRHLTVLRARELRAGETSGEAALWNELRGKKLEGVRFRRQHPLGSFVLDFFAPSLRLAIEIDGPMHDRRREYDARRQARLEAAGVWFVRFSADEIDSDLPSCLARLRGAICTRTRRQNPTPERPLPSARFR